MKINLRLIWAASLALLFIGVTGCSNVDKAMQEQGEKTKSMAAEAQRQVGMPRIVNFTELKLLNWLFELRDTEGLKTYTYVRDYEGRLHHLCNSIGYGMPFSAQRTSPEQPAVVNPGNTMGGKQTFVLPQPEPNGMFPPTSSSATWVICISKDGKPAPLYEESLITVSVFPLRAVDSYTLNKPPSWK